MIVQKDRCPSKPEFMEKVMKRYAFKDWDSVLASIDMVA